MPELEIVYLNGEYLAKDQAKISIMDRGFLFGDGVYEVIPVFDGNMFGVDEHLARLKRSLQGICLSSPLANEQLLTIFKELLKRNHKLTGAQAIYLQITRGPQQQRDHAIPKSPHPTIVAFCISTKSVPRKVAAKGYCAITLEDTRRQDCSVKAITLLPNILLYEEAKKAGAHEAILIRCGRAMEGTSSNLFVVKDEHIYTPPLTREILHGITRAMVIKIAKDYHLNIHEQPIPTDLLFSADEIWLTGSSREISPITTLNNKPVGTGQVGPMWHKMMDYYETIKKNTE